MNHVELVTQLDGQHLEQLPELIEASRHADGHEPLGEHKFLRIRRGDDLAVALLAYEEGRLAGYAHTLAYGDEATRRVSCEFVVHPEQRGRGVGKLLLSRAVQHAESLGAHRLDVWAYNDSKTSSHLARQLGFTARRRLLHLHRHLTSAPKYVSPEGAGIRCYRPGEDDAQWLALNNRIFSGHPENGCWTLDDLRARLSQPWFNAEDFLVLDIDGEMAGFCWLKVEERGTEGRVGEIYVIGTAPEHRGRGLGKFLVAAALAHLRTRAANVAAIYVDEANAPAVALYEQSGFHYHHVDVCYSRDLRVESIEPVADGVAA
jgi:mycothiol synthase